MCCVMALDQIAITYDRFEVINTRGEKAETSAAPASHASVSSSFTLTNFASRYPQTLNHQPPCPLRRNLTALGAHCTISEKMPRRLKTPRVSRYQACPPIKRLRGIKLPEYTGNFV